MPRKKKPKKKTKPDLIVRKDGSVTESWGWSTSKRAEPFALGNFAHERTGHRSLRRVLPLAEQLIAGLLEQRPDLAAHPEALHAWARAEARCILLSRGDFLDAQGATINAKDIRWAESAATQQRMRLGLDPKSEAELHRSRAEAARSVVDLDAIRQRGRAALQRAEDEGA